MKQLFDPTNESFLVSMQNNAKARLISNFSALKTSTVRNDKEWHDLQNCLRIVIVSSRLECYRLGCIDVARKADPITSIRLRRDGADRAKWVANEMKTWTLKSLDLLQSSKRSDLLSDDRADKVASYEMRLAAFTGRLAGWKENRAAKKSWLVSDAHDNDDTCDDCEDDGIIAVGEPFTSGDMAPPAHPNCLCSLWLHL